MNANEVLDEMEEWANGLIRWHSFNAANQEPYQRAVEKINELRAKLNPPVYTMGQCAWVTFEGDREFAVYDGEEYWYLPDGATIETTGLSKITPVDTPADPAVKIPSEAFIDYSWDQ